ncbi:hypothetical protein Vadar_000168 [Vaccinium darrowii]|uniref:Uncharacterized protein n=1 Tax=Vaccinium darrowii TaxID=229202 RepID=A0ACB7XEV9_9ERIC|nr:hypothetical protein Vadar_000168 [Vaccinium darrowii]
MFLIQESKLAKLERIEAVKLWGDADMDYAIAESEGASGGLITMWNKKAFQAHHILARRNFIIVKGELFGSFECIIINIYAPNDIRSRRELWKELVQLKTTFQVPWCLGGAFNEVKRIGERVGCLRSDRGMREFNDFINLMEVHDLPMMGRKFTWSNFQDNRAQSRLDRILFHGTMLKHLYPRLCALGGDKISRCLYGQVSHFHSGQPLFAPRSFFGVEDYLDDDNSRPYTYQKGKKSKNPGKVTSKQVAVAGTNSNDIKAVLKSRSDIPACLAIGRILAERAREADVYTASYTPRERDKFEGKIRAVVQSLIDNGSKTGSTAGVGGGSTPKVKEDGLANNEGRKEGVGSEKVDAVKPRESATSTTTNRKRKRKLAVESGESCDTHLVLTRRGGGEDVSPLKGNALSRDSKEELKKKVSTMDKGTGFVAVDRDKEGIIQRRVNAEGSLPNRRDSDSSCEPDPVFYECPDPEFNDFDKGREENCFAVDQLWACYDTADGMPRFYARIRKVFSPEFKLWITWLESCPEDQDEINWLNRDLPIACGKFIHGDTEETIDRLMFSHQVPFDNEVVDVLT